MSQSPFPWFIIVLLLVASAKAQSPGATSKALRDDGSYQDGGYWATPLPWLMETLMRVDPVRAATAFCDAVEDFQARKDINEWVNDNAPRPRGIRDYCASASMPLAGAKRLRVTLTATGSFQYLVREESWTEKWPDVDGKLKTRAVTAEVWTAAMQAALDTQRTLRIPAREKPYYLDGPIILKSGQRLVADPKAEIRLKPGCNTCMVRNENIVGFADRPVPEETICDTDIQIEGGIWTTLATGPGEVNGNLQGGSSQKNPVFGTHGVFLLHNVEKVTVKNVTVRQSKPFAIHFGNAHDFLVEGLTLDDHRRDGVHVNGPASNGVIRRVSGVSQDDPVALNAWEWKNYAPSYGPIHDVLVEDVTGTPDGVPATNSIRLLPGVKRFDDGTTLACPLENITLRRITDIREFKLYDQPNLELGRDKDFSIGVGTLKNIHFGDLVFNCPGVIEVHANTDGLAIQNVKLNFPVTPDYHLLAIGPKSQTYKYGRSEDPARWTEIFSPDLDCTVRNLSVSGVRTQNSRTDLPIEQVVHVVELKRNPDYPKTTPRGGTGKGIWIR